jgi:two-component system, LytTR family, sensor kinase
MKERSESRIEQRELLLIFAFWTFIALLSSVNRVLDPRGFGFRVRAVSPAPVVLLEFIDAWTWALVTPLVFWLTTRLSAGQAAVAKRIAILLGAGVLIAITLDLVFELIRLQILPRPPRRMVRFSAGRDIMRFRWVNQLLVYLAVLAAAFARDYYLRYQRRQHEASQLRAQLADARLDALRMQLNPHFLFNTLHAVSALVDRDPSGVRRMIARLSELLRHTIDSRGSDEVSLREELDFLRRYIEIMEIRFQGRLHVETQADDGVLDALVPNLILQPIVENALEHGASRTNEGRVEISARRFGDDLVLTVRDNGPGLSAAESKGIGLTNTEARLEQLYGDAASLTIGAADGGGVLATVIVPFHTARDLRTHGV